MWKGREQRGPKGLVSDQRGLTTIEYLLTACLVCVVGMAAWDTLGGEASAKVSGVTSETLASLQTVPYSPGAPGQPPAGRAPKMGDVPMAPKAAPPVDQASILLLNRTTNGVDGHGTGGPSAARRALAAVTSPPPPPAPGQGGFWGGVTGAAKSALGTTGGPEDPVAAAISRMEACRTQSCLMYAMQEAGAHARTGADRLRLRAARDRIRAEIGRTWKGSENARQFARGFWTLGFGCDGGRYCEMGGLASMAVPVGTVAGAAARGTVWAFRAAKGARAASRGRPAASSLQGAQLREHLRQVERYGAGKVRELENGRFRYYGEWSPARTDGPMAGRRLVREWNPSTGAARTWHETLDHSSRVRIVRPQAGGPKRHYTFDEGGNFSGTF